MIRVGASVAVGEPVHLQHLAERALDGQPRVERRERILEDELDPARERAALAASSAAASGAPSISTVPEVGGSSPTSSRASVDLPQPLSPTTPSVRPASSSSETSRTARTGGRPAPARVLLDEPVRPQHHLTHVDGSFQQAARWPGPRSISGGSSAAQRVVGRRAAEAERAAAAELRRVGRRAADLAQRHAVRGVRPGQRGEQRRRVRDAAGRAKMSRVAATLDDPPGVHHGDAIDEPRDDAEVVRHPDDRHPRLGVQRLDELEDLLLDRDVERRRRLVGDQHARRGREAHRDHHALQHPARELVRIGALDPLRVGQADVAEHLARPRRGARRR